MAVGRTDQQAHLPVRGERKVTAVSKAAAKAALAAVARDAAIREAHENGATIRAIATEAGLSAARIHQIIHGR